MKIFTFYSNRFKTATTSLHLAESHLAHTVLVHTEDQAAQFKTHGTAPGDVLVTGTPPGLAYQRNAALDLMETGEWAAFLCDDLLRVLSFPEHWINSRSTYLDFEMSAQQPFRMVEDHKITLERMFSYFPKLMDIAEANKIHLIGFSLVNNPLFQRRKFGTKGLADGRFWLVKKSFYRFDENVQLVDDVGWTAENLVRHGRVLVFNWLLPEFSRYTAGGFGSIEKRLEMRRRECAHLVHRFYPLVKHAKKTNWPDGTHIRIFGSEKNIMLARRKTL